MNEELTNNPIENTLNITKMTQETLANYLGISRQSLINYKKYPENIPYAILLKLSKLTGLTIEKLYGRGMEKCEGPKLTPTYRKNSKNLKNVLRKVQGQFESIGRQYESLKKQYKSIDEEIYGSRLKEIDVGFKNTISIAKKMSKKPTVCSFGQSDTGKSTLINYILQEDVAPAGYTPMTTVPVYFMHVSEKPSYMKNSHENAVVFGEKKSGDISEKNNKFIHDNYLDETYTKGLILKEGDHKSILQSFGTRDGAYYDSDSYLIYEIIIFLDNDILNEITFVDIPGFGSGDTNDDIGLTMDMANIDIVLFLSLANGFLRGDEITIIKQILSTRTLEGFYLLATHANAIGNPKEVNDIIDKGCARLVKAMTNEELEHLNITENDYKALRDCCFGFDPYNALYCESFNNNFQKKIPKFIKSKLGYCIENLKKLSRVCKEKYDKDLIGLDNKLCPSKVNKINQEKEFRAIKERANKEIKENLYRVLKECKEDSANKFVEDYDSVINEEFIVQALKNKEVKNKKSDLEDFSVYISSELKDRVNSNLKNQSTKFSDEVTKSLKNYKNTLFNSEEYNIKIDMDDFNFERAFATGLTSISVYGALAIWASIIAAGSNLGAYILVAKVVSVLSAIGISVGGTAAATSFIASIGGPVTLGIAIAIVGAIAVFGIFTGKWRNRVAKKLIKAYESEGAREKYLANINEFWNSDTKQALDKCLESLDDEINKYFKEKSKILSICGESIYENTKVVLKYVYSMVIDMYTQLIDINDIGSDEN